MKHNSTINEQEINKFDSLADEWWDLKGKFKILHQINPIRIEYIKDKIEQHFSEDKNLSTENLSVLDIGCGGGLVSTAFARTGYKVTAIDASSKNIEVAKNYASRFDLDIDYKHGSIEDLSAQEGVFDVVLALEMLEHIDNHEHFIAQLSKLIKKDGLIIFSTLNRSIKSFMLGIVAAEYILRWVPRGTHSYKKFLKPSEINEYLKINGLQITEMRGMNYNLLTNKWIIDSNISVNYFMVIKPMETI